MTSILEPIPSQPHFHDSRDQERVIQPHPTYTYPIQGPLPIRKTTTLSQRDREMLAAQQHFGYPMQQQQQQTDNQTAGSTPSGGWNDDSEFFLRNLLSNNNVTSPLTSASGNSGIGSSPSYIEDNRNSLSPSSSTGFQSLHDFIHNGTTNFPTPPLSDASGGYQGPTPEQLTSKASMLLQQQMQQHQQIFAGQEQPAMDANALNYFVNSMVNGGGNERPIMNPTSQGASLDPSLVSPMYNYTQGTPAFNFHPHMFGQQTLSVPQQQHQQQPQQPNYPQYQEMLTQSHQAPMQSQHPALDGRKRSAPGAMISETDTTNKSAAPPARNIKKMKTQTPIVQNPPSNTAPSWKVASSTTSQFNPSSMLPRMEVGSNATALAAIERLKAKRKAEFDQKVKMEQSNASSNVNDSPKGSSIRPGDSNNGSGEPVQRSQKKVAHNAIERRYRNNINDRITALRNAVPALRELRPKKPGSSRKGKGAQEQDLVDGVPAATKLNKATILGKATEYIRYLKGRETRLVSEVAGLRELIRSLEGGEELLDLWEGEMENVVAEQEAKAKAAFALEDDSYDMEDDDDDDDEEEESDIKPSSRSPSGSSSSSRYMMGVFMGFSVLGGGAELAHNHNAASSSSSHVESVVRASSGRVFGASHQLLKRGMNVSKLKIGRVVDVPHHYDHIPSHVLAAEVIRGVALLACLAFIFWPIIGHYINKSSKTGSKPEIKRRGSLKQKRKEMLGALARSRPRPHEMDLSMRNFIGAPTNAFQSGFALASIFVHESLCRLRLTLREPIDEEQAAVWCRLLELETSLGPLAHRSLLARLHTLVTVGTLPNIGKDVKTASAVMVPARVYGTMAIAMVRAARGHNLMISLAERRWNMARRCRLLVEEEEEETDQSRWIDNVLEHSLSDAIALCPSPTLVAATFAPKVDSNTRASLLAPLPSIAAIQHGRQLTNIWEVLLSQIVQDTCPISNDETPPSVSDFIKHHAEVKIFLSLVSTQTDQDRLSSQISRLTSTAPKYDCWQTLSIVTFGTWALLLGNVAIARSVAAAIMSAKEISELPACAIAFIRLIFDGSDEILAGLPSGSIEAVNEVDALAAASLNWLLLLRRISSTISGQYDYSDEVVEKAILIRRLLATARMAKNTNDETLLLSSAIVANNGSNSDLLSSHRDSLASTMTSQSKDDDSTNSMILSEDGQVNNLFSLNNDARLDESLDTLTDILAMLGKKAALGLLKNWKSSTSSSDQESEKHDSGVEWGL